MSEGSLPLPIAIIGGGFTGLACSVALTRHRIPHRIYESAECFEQVATSMVTGPNALASLKAIHPRLWELFQSCAAVNSHLTKSSSWFTFRHGMESVPQSAVEIAPGGIASFGTVIAEVDACGPTEHGRSCVDRGAFLEEIIRLIPAGIAEFGKQLIDLEDDGVAVKLTFKDGTTAWASAVLACDGIKSVARRKVLQSDPSSIEPAYAGEYCYRKIVPMNEARLLLGEDMALNGNIFCGYNGHITTYPVDHNRYLTLVAVRRQAESVWPKEGTWSQPCSADSMLQDFEGWGKPILQLLNGVGAQQKLEKLALFDSQRATRYYRGRICLLGNAAHASTPHQGAGDGMGFEDACLMGHLLRRAQDVREIFQVFDKIRRPRTQRLVVTSRAASKVFSFSHEEVSDFLSIRYNLFNRHSWIWRFDIADELKRADQQCQVLSYPYQSRREVLLHSQLPSIDEIDCLEL